MAVASQERILVVEDEADLAASLTARLEAVGYAVHTERSGSEALRYAAHHRPDLVILDVQLPDVCGYEVCEQLRRAVPHAELPVLMFSVMDTPADEMRGFASGADAYLPKRCRPTDLLQTIAQLLREPD